jgi:hypothetical protein
MTQLKNNPESSLPSAVQPQPGNERQNVCAWLWAQPDFDVRDDGGTQGVVDKVIFWSASPGFTTAATR